MGVARAVWASSADIQASLEAPQLTEDQRVQVARKAEQKAAKKKAKRERQRARKAGGEDDGAEEEAALDEAEAAAGLEASQAFDELLSEMKLEEQARQAPT